MDTLDAIRNRRSVRSYSQKSIPPELLERMKQSLRYAPSACNNQPWHFVLVKDPEVRRQVAQAANHAWMAQAPVTVVACGLPSQAYKRMGGYGNSVDVDLAIAVDHLTLAAASEGLGTCWIGAFKEEQVKAVLGIPEGVKIVALTPLGYPASADMISPAPESRRRPMEELFSIDRYDGPAS